MFLNLADRLLFHSTIYPFILQWWITIAMIGVVFGWGFIVFKKSLGFNTKIKKTTWLILGVFMLLFLIVNLSFNSFRAADEEWASIYRAKTMLNGNQRVYAEENSGIVFPLLAAGLLKLGNSFIPLIRIVNICLGTISLFLIFECAYLIFDNEKASLFSVFIYVLTPWTYRYTGILFGLPTLVHFLSLLSLLAILLAFKYHKLYLHILSLASLLVLNQTKLEYFLYYFIYLAIFFAVKEYKKLAKKEIIIFTIMIIICFIPAIFKSAQFKFLFLANPDWCGVSAQTIDAHYSYGNIVNKIDDILQKLINKRVALSYFFGDLPIFVKFWGQKTLILPITTAIIGIYLALKEYPQKKLFLSFPALFFLSLAIGYLFDCGWYEARHAISAYGFIAIFSGYCFWWFLSQNKLFKVEEIFIHFMLIFLISAQLIICSQVFENYRNGIRTFVFKYQSYYLYKDLMRNISNQSAIFLSVDDNSAHILKLLGYKSKSWNDYINNNSATINPQKVVDHFFTSELTNFKNKVYFIKSPACDEWDFYKIFCDKAESEAKEMVGEIYIKTEDSKIKLFVLKND